MHLPLTPYDRWRTDYADPQPTALEIFAGQLRDGLQSLPGDVYAKVDVVEETDDAEHYIAIDMAWCCQFTDRQQIAASFRELANTLDPRE